MKKKYIISATICDSKIEAEDMIRKWHENGTYNEETVIYEISDDTPQYMGVIKLKKMGKYDNY